MAALLAQKIAALFVIIIAGIVLVKSRLFAPADARMFSKLLLYAIVPCSVFNAFMIDRSAEILRGLMAAMAASLIIHALMLALSYALKKPLALSPVERNSIVYSNAGNLIIPIVTAMLGPEWVIYSTAYMALNQALLFTQGKSVMLGRRSCDFQSIIKTPVIIAMLLGALVFGFKLKPPFVLRQGIANMGSMVGALSMLVAGMRIGGLKLREAFKYKRVWLVLTLRLIALPLMAIPLLKLTTTIINSEIVTKAALIVFLAASAPSASTVVNLAVLYDKEADYASVINAVSTLCCVLTMPLMVLLFELVI